MIIVMEMLEIIKGTIIGVICGTITALLGYAKSVTSEEFDPKKAIQTMVVGAVVGGVSGYYGWTYDQAEEWASNIGLVTLTEYLKKAIWRKIKGK